MANNLECLMFFSSILNNWSVFLQICIQIQPLFCEKHLRTFFALFPNWIRINLMNNYLCNTTTATTLNHQLVVIEDEHLNVRIRTWAQQPWLLSTFFNICATLSHVSSVSVKLIKSYELKLIKSREIINQVYLEQDVHLDEMPGRVKCQGNSKLWKF